jgi:hypothetical protein
VEPAGEAIVFSASVAVEDDGVVVLAGGIVEPAGGIFGSVVDDAADALPSTSP